MNCGFAIKGKHGSWLEASSYSFMTFASACTSLWLINCSIVDNLPCATKFEMDNKESQVEQGYKLGFVVNNEVRSPPPSLHKE